MSFFWFICLIGALVMFGRASKAKAAAQRIAAEAQTEARKEAMRAETIALENEKLNVRIKQLAPYAAIEDAKAHARQIELQAADLLAKAKVEAQAMSAKAQETIQQAQQLQGTASALQNIIDGYGNRYLVPTFSLLDDLAEGFSHTEAGNQLKQAREKTRAIIKSGAAGVCDYSEATRRETAVRFVVDAFNGKVDSILSRIKSDNHGTLEQEIRDAFHVVNYSGAAFRNARITDGYLQARLDELRWGATVQALRDQEREEQRRIKEVMREEERARREYERAIKDAAKEEDVIKKALAIAQQQAAAASEAQKSQFEAQLRELEAKLQAAEEKNQRALSMAQQTRVGHVYVISNIGSFGEDVFKIGMTRRLDPLDRVRELGDASVPFEFDVHALIFSQDAPALERQLHQRFMRNQVNKVNPRKEFFRLSLSEIRQAITDSGIQAQWTTTAEAQQYRESLRLEQQLRESPALAKEWEQHQIEAEQAQELEDAALVSPPAPASTLPWASMMG